MVRPDETVRVPSVGGRPDRDISRHKLAMMIEPRVEEIFAHASKEIRKHHAADLLGAGVVLTSSTPIVDVTGPEPREHRGRVPARSVVIPGTRPKQFPAGIYQVPAALIIGARKASTDKKTSLNDALREFGIPT